MTPGTAFQAMVDALPTTFEGLLRASQLPPPTVMRLVVQGQNAGVLAPVSQRPSDAQRYGAAQVYGLAPGGWEKRAGFVATLEMGAKR